MKFPGFVGALDIHPLQLSGVVQVLKYLLLFIFFAHIPLASLVLHNTEVPWHSSPNLCVPFWWFLSLLFSAFFLSRKLQGAFRRNLMSHNSAASSPCPLALQSHFLIPFLHYLPSHPVGMPRTLSTPSGQQRDRKKWRNNILQGVTQQVDSPSSTSLSLLLLPSTGVCCLPAIPSPPSYYKHSSGSFVSCPWGIASVWPAELAPILHSPPRAWLFPHLSVQQQTHVGHGFVPCVLSSPLSSEGVFLLKFTFTLVLKVVCRKNKSWGWLMSGRFAL